MPIKQLTYQGGINISTSLGTMPSNQLLSASNVQLSGASLVNRGGPFKVVNVAGSGSTNYVTGLFYWVQDTSNEWFIMEARDAGGNVGIYQMLNNGIVSSATKISTGVVNEYIQCAVLNGVLVVCPAGDVQYKWTGSGNLAALGASWTTLSVSSGPIRVVNNFLFIASGSTVHWSNVADPTTYTPGNDIPFRSGDGDSIYGLSNIGTDLIIFKSRSTARLSTQTVNISGAVTLGPLTTISQSIGCALASAHDQLPDGRIVFVNPDGRAYIFDGSTFTDISNPQYPLGNVTLTAPGVITGAMVVKVYPPRNEVWFITPSGTTTYLIYDYFNNCWFQKPFTGAQHGLRILAMAYPQKIGGLGSIQAGSSFVYDKFSCLLSGDNNGDVWIEDCGITVDQSGSFPVIQIEFSIPVPADDRQNFKRFFVLPLKAGSAQTVNYYTGRDGTYGSSISFTTTGLWDRLQIAIPSSKSATSYQIKITYSTADTIQFDPAYISEEGDQ